MTNPTSIPAAAGSVVAGAQAEAPKELPLDEALQSLKTYDWGVARETLGSIDAAVRTTHGDAAARAKLEKALVDALAGGVSRSAQDFICRRLRVIGTKTAVNALAALLGNPETSHIARYALERLEDDAAGDALRAALPKADAKTRPGLIGSLGVRRDKAATAAIAACLGDADPLTVQAACRALALIGTPEAAQALGAFVKKAPEALKVPAADAGLICAERLTADGDKAGAQSLYGILAGDNMPKTIQRVATRSLSKADNKKE
jgi:HEAT repeat protein